MPSSKIATFDLHLNKGKLGLIAVQDYNKKYGLHFKIIFSAALHRYIEKLQTEDLGDLQKKHEQQQAIQEEIEILNQQKELQKKKRMEEDKMQDMQVFKIKEINIKKKIKNLN